MEVMSIAVLSALSVEAGGFLALQYKNKLNLILSFTAGVLLGLVAFDLLPEIFKGADTAGISLAYPMIAFVVGFLAFHMVEKFILVHNSQEEGYVLHTHPQVGVASAVALIGHSLFDGISIGVAFQVNSSVGLAVSIAVIAHRFVDGFNGINLMLKHKNKPGFAKKILVLVAIAPILGALLTLFFVIPESILVIYLGFFAGFLLYISASDILPQAHSRQYLRGSTSLIIMGVAFMFLVTRLI